MKLLVLAQTPPPVHGQSLMVGTLVQGLPSHGIEVHHVNLGLSRDTTDIGKLRPGKVLAVLAACFHAVSAHWREGCDTLYYVPAPGKRGALFRDWLVMLLCRPFFRRLVLHFHTGGLAEWLATRATTPERWLTALLLGRADLAIVLAETLRADGAALSPKRITIVPNGISDPHSDGHADTSASHEPFGVLFLGLCTADKGLFAAARAVLEANRRSGRVAFVLTAAGPYASADDATRFAELCAGHARELRHAGIVHGAAKRALLEQSRCLCLPTCYAHEAQPLVALEALAFDRPVVASRWRALPEIVPPSCGRLIGPEQDVSALADALISLRENPPNPGVCRAHFLSHYTKEKHLSALAAALCAS